MLTHLAIRNYATVESIDMEFGPGMSAITGETGAGKSIILGALGLTLGDRADRTVVRKGASRMEVSAGFTLDNLPGAVQWLTDKDLSDDEGEGCLVRRVVAADGKSRAYVNGSAVPLATLRELGAFLIEIHGQHEHQSLLKRETHGRLLDEFGVDSALCQALASAFKDWQENASALQQLSQQSEEDSAQQQLLSFQLQELEELSPVEGEAQKLDSEFNTLSNAELTLQTAARAMAVCEQDDEGNVRDQLGHAIAGLRALQALPEQLNAALELLEAAEIQVEEAAVELRRFSDGFAADPERLEQINQRLGQLHDMARKHRIEVHELPAFTASLEASLQQLQNSDAELERLRAQDQAFREAYRKAATRVSKQRGKAARALEAAVNDQLRHLGMGSASIKLVLEPLPQDVPQARGLEAPEILVSTNPGADHLAISRVASGGELSRISLAIQVVTAQKSNTPSLVFDEVDVGIGGDTARTVGEVLRTLGASAQIICVTHQAQVASQAHCHYFVTKTSSQDAANSDIRRLNGDEKIKEVARMLGGSDFSDESLAHAQQLVAEA